MADDTSLVQRLEPRRSNTDMPRLTLRVNLDEIEAAAQFGALAIWRFASDKDFGVVLVQDRGPGHYFTAYATKTGVTVWSNKSPRGNPIKVARASRQVHPWS